MPCAAPIKLVSGPARGHPDHELRQTGRTIIRAMSGMDIRPTQTSGRTLRRYPEMSNASVGNNSPSRLSEDRRIREN